MPPLFVRHFSRLHLRRSLPPPGGSASPDLRAPHRAAARAAPPGRPPRGLTSLRRSARSPCGIPEGKHHSRPAPTRVLALQPCCRSRPAAAQVWARRPGCALRHRCRNAPSSLSNEGPPGRGLVTKTSEGLNDK